MNDFIATLPNRLFKITFITSTIFGILLKAFYLHYIQDILLQKNHNYLVELILVAHAIKRLLTVLINQS